MSLHRLFIQTLGSALRPGVVSIEGEEAQHAARVKRLGVGDPVDVLDGRGRVGRGRIAGVSRPGGVWRVDVEVGDVRIEPPVRPRVEVYSAVPKGSRLNELIEGLSQVGAARWSALATGRGVAGAGEHKLGRVERIAAEASKQCGRAWLMEIGEPVALGGVLGPGASVVVGDGSGEPFAGTGAAEMVRLLVGPEGGWTAQELERARGAGARVASFGPHTMRIETAAVVACAAIIGVGRG
jgi:16S rRNA (uracil1498-N3)-methyltransferase